MAISQWIKIEHLTPDKPEVIIMADILEMDQDTVVGKLVRLWIWADQQTISCNAVCVTDSFINRYVSCPGFAAALRKVGWLEGRDAALQLPNFSRHNGQTAKQRAETNRRVSNHREKSTEKCNAKSVTKTVQKPLPEEEEDIGNNKGVRRVPMGNRGQAGTIEEVKQYCHTVGLSAEDAEWYWYKCEGSGWQNDGKPITDWRANLKAWSIRGDILPSQQKGKSAPGVKREPAWKIEQRIKTLRDELGDLKTPMPAGSDAEMRRKARRDAINAEISELTAQLERGAA